MNDKNVKKASLSSVEPDVFEKLQPMESALRQQIQTDEENHTLGDRGSNTLWHHLKRVARIATRIASQEGVNPLHAHLAGLFHDSGKFAEGCYHKGEKPEETYSIEILKHYAKRYALDETATNAVADSIEQLYRDDPDPTDLTRVLFDADNLDKLGPLGIANYFVKAGLRGGGVSESMLYRFTVELTYARHAEGSMTTDTGRALAKIRAPYTIQFLKDLMENLREDQLHNFRIETIEFGDLTLDVVSPPECRCGGNFKRRIWEIPGIKCSEIHLAHTCASCDNTHELRFCRPKLLKSP